jgi:NAD(P)-dependent dehydrogenase (short-subunit alcohol dehydrogenase family)
VAVQADLATSEGIESLWEQVTALGRKLDIACINAGVGVGGLFVDTDLGAEPPRQASQRSARCDEKRHAREDGKTSGRRKGRALMDCNS